MCTQTDSPKRGRCAGVPSPPSSAPAAGTASRLRGSLTPGHARTPTPFALGPGCADIPSRAVPQQRACQPLPLVTRPQTEPRKLPQALTETHQVRDASNTTEARAEWPNLPPREKGTREMLPVRVSVGYETCRTYEPNFHFTSWKTKAVKTCSLPTWRLVDSWTTTFQCIRIYA